ncbi:MAG: phage tail tube protein [archaeon]|nr:phage tail tube protein [archaeon]
MINGNSVIAQMGLESSYGVSASATKQYKISSESLKAVYNKIDEGLATGGRGMGLKATMGIGVNGSESTLFRADMGYLIAGVLGVESADASGDKTNHTFTAIESSESAHLPSWTMYVDRKVGKFKYTGCKINALTLSASAGDYLKCDFDVVGKEEIDNATLGDLTPSTLKAFKFAQAKMYKIVDDVETTIADVDSISLAINNNCDAQTQTTDTGDFYKEPEVGVRDIQLTASVIYSAGTEEFRKAFYKSDDTCGVKVEFVGDDGNKLTITLPCVQMADADANMGGLDTLKQNMTLSVVDNLVDELITIELLNDDAEEYI